MYSNRIIKFVKTSVVLKVFCAYAHQQFFLRTEKVFPNVDVKNHLLENEKRSQPQMPSSTTSRV